MILRRVQLADGRTRAFINDQAISVQTLRRSAPRWSRSTASMTSARWSMPPPIAACSTRSPGWRRTSPRSKHCGTRGARPTPLLEEHRAAMERAAREADYLRHAADELKTLAPKDGEETALAERRTTMMQGEKIAADLREAQDAVSGNHSPVAALSAAVRRLERRAGNSPRWSSPR